ncbi:hypothetical protein [Sulfobacillus harzensis]|uniref:Uncharacterized protein n=1 Tax=Sulfobacillus harzensis TaxID=2729629 RepID=A0A7Y0L2M7_9FIRM|nr:hypothetical protein [Sulfobacillus harzensis]NMP22167.1 hypothetical protein [Sulfobacillus harzensis]
MTTDELVEAYYTFAAEGETLIPFVREVLKGSYGPPERQPLLHFIDTIEAIIMGNIETRFDEGPGLEANPDAVREETERETNEARMLVLHTLPAERTP